jgi:hypothetical protein
MFQGDSSHLQHDLAFDLARLTFSRKETAKIQRYATVRLTASPGR